MTPEELADKCRKQQELQGRPDAMVVMVMPGIRAGETRRLAGRSGPKGNLVGTTSTHSQIAFKADEILAWLRVTK